MFKYTSFLLRNWDWNWRRHTVTVTPLILLSSSLTFRCVSSTSSSKNPSFSFTVSYLIETCGLSKESALTASKLVRFETSENPNAVIALFKSQGFSQTQITKIIKNRPMVLVYDVEGTLLPKLQFLRSRGVSSSDLVKIVTHNSPILVTSLERQIIPAFNLIANLLQSDEKTVLALRHYPRLISYDVESYVLPNLDALRNSGVPKPNILSMFASQPQILLKRPVELKDIIETVKKMGFNPTRMGFLKAVYVLITMSRSTWEKKVDTFKKWGWSEEDILKAFRSQPYFVLASKDKINATLHFLMNKMGFQSSAIASYPIVVMMSFEKRLLPRGLFVQDLLLSKGVVKDFNLPALFHTSEEVFVEKFVNCYEAEASMLLKLYQAKLDLSSNWKASMEASAHVES